MKSNETRAARVLEEFARTGTVSGDLEEIVDEIADEIGSGPVALHA